jgi:hypothetical protein
LSKGTAWRPLDEISPHLIRAAIAGEDARFCRHHGFDWGAVATAWDRYQSGHGRLLGASTISMQTAKNVFLWPGRDWLRKGFEAWFTALVELAWGKRRIVEIYLNVAEWGPGLYGAEAAARRTPRPRWCDRRPRSAGFTRHPATNLSRQPALSGSKDSNFQACASSCRRSAGNASRHGSLRG